MKQKTLTLIYLSLALISFSAYEVVCKTIVGQVDATQLTVIRFLAGGLFLLPFAIADMKKNNRKITAKDLLYMLLLGFLNVTVSMNLIQLGYAYTNANLAAIIVSANPIFVALFSAMILRESLTWKKAFGLMVGISGVLVAMGGAGNLSKSYVIYGILLQVAGMLAFSLYTVLGKKIARRLGSCTMAACTDLLGALTLLPFLFTKGHALLNFSIASIWPQLIYICLINTGVAFYLYFKALETLDTSLGAMSFLVKPILASVIAAVFLGENVTWQILLGIMLVAGGIFLVLYSGRPNAKKPLMQ